MNILFVRRPNFITIDTSVRTGSRVELRFRTKSTSYPTNADYSISKPRVTTSSVSERYNISDYAREYIKINAPTTVANGIESDDVWCFVEVKRFTQTAPTTFNLIDTVEYICLNGSNASVFVDTTLFLHNIDLDIQYNLINTTYVNALVNHIGGDVKWNNVTILNNSNANGFYLLKLILNQNKPNLNFLERDAALFFGVGSVQICEPKYSPIIVFFINRFGGWQPLTFFKNKIETIETESKEFEFLGGNKKAFNFQGTESIKINTGYVDENYNELIQDLLLSENILIGDRKALIKSKSQPKKTSLNDKLINFEIEFVYSDNLIFDVL